MRTASRRLTPSPAQIVTIEHASSTASPPNRQATGCLATFIRQWRRALTVLVTERHHLTVSQEQSTLLRCPNEPSAYKTLLTSQGFTLRRRASHTTAAPARPGRRSESCSVTPPASLRQTGVARADALSLKPAALRASWATFPDEIRKWPPSDALLLSTSGVEGRRSQTLLTHIRSGRLALAVAAIR